VLVAGEGDEDWAKVGGGEAASHTAESINTASPSRLEIGGFVFIEYISRS
jgi:hypothetical protein